MTVLSDHQWHLLSDDGEIDLVFGTASTGIQTSMAPDLGQDGYRSDGIARVREDGASFGTDYAEGKTLTFEANVLSDSWEAQSDLLDDFERCWKAENFRDDPSRYGVLRVCEAGRTRRVYGRPRRFVEADGDNTKDGYTGAIFDFSTYDGKFYDDEEQSVGFSLVPPTLHGLSDPLKQPLLIPAPAETLGTVHVEGKQRTWVVAKFHGPVTNPSLKFGEDFTLTVEATIPDGQTVTVDPRPWSRGITRSDGARLPGVLSWDSPQLKRLKIKPGMYVVNYLGSDPTGTSTAEIFWRTAHERP